MRSALMIAAVIAVGTGLWLQGSFLHTILGLGAVIYVAMPAGLILAVWSLLARWRTGEIPLGLRRAASAVALLWAVVIISLALGRAIHNAQIRNAFAYVDDMIPLLEDYRDLHGAYPPRLADLESDLPPPPSFLADPDSYSGFETSFQFLFWDNDSLAFDGYLFDSDRREWAEID